MTNVNTYELMCKISSVERDCTSLFQLFDEYKKSIANSNSNSNVVSPQLDNTYINILFSPVTDENGITIMHNVPCYAPYNTIPYMTDLIYPFERIKSITVKGISTGYGGVSDNTEFILDGNKTKIEHTSGDNYFFEGYSIRQGDGRSYLYIDLRGYVFILGASDGFVPLYIKSYTIKN